MIHTDGTPTIAMTDDAPGIHPDDWRTPEPPEDLIQDLRFEVWQHSPEDADHRYRILIARLANPEDASDLAELLGKHYRGLRFEVVRP